jgi:hypothetical protein
METKKMRSVILMGCLSILALTGFTQGTNGREKSGTPLRWSQNGNQEVLVGEIYRTFNDTDTSKAKTQKIKSSTALGGNPNSTKFSSVQALCDHNSIRFNWIAMQQYAAGDRYEIEQSSDDGRNWSTIGSINANRTELGEAAYSYIYNKNLGKILFRISAVNIAGEKVYSSVIESPCTNTNYLSISPNPVTSSTTLRIGAAAATKIKIVLVNSSGMVKLNKEVGVLQGNNQVPIDMSSLQPGSYVMSVNWNGGSRETFTLIKQ